MRISDWSSDVCSSDLSSGQSWSMTSYCPVPGVGPESPSDHDYAGGFATALMLKDLRLAIEAAASVDDDTPIVAKARDLYEPFAAAGNGALAVSATTNKSGRDGEEQTTTPQAGHIRAT